MIKEISLKRYLLGLYKTWIYGIFVLTLFISFRHYWLALYWEKKYEEIYPPLKYLLFLFLLYLISNCSSYIFFLNLLQLHFYSHQCTETTLSITFALLNSLVNYLFLFYMNHQQHLIQLILPSSWKHFLHLASRTLDFSYLCLYLRFEILVL